MKIFAIGLALDAIVTAFTAVVLVVLWGWFVQGSLTDYHLGFWQAGGISIIVGLLTNQHIPRNGTDDFADLILYNLLAPAVALLMGFIFHLGLS